MILRATIGRRCVCRVIFFFFFFLDIFPLLFTKYFFLSLYSFQWHGDNQIWDEIFSLLFWLPFESSYELLVIQSLDLHINYGFEWHLFDRADGFSLPLFPLSPFSIPPCLFVVSQYLNRVFLFLRFCVSVQMYEMCPSAVWPCRCGREPMRRVDLFLFDPVL
jgi:hypothetical protein